MGDPARVWKFGDNIDTDALAPGRYMSAPIDVLASHCLETVRPEFAAQVSRGDIIVAGANFGMGSSREQAVEALRHLGIAAVIAQSFAGIFYRNAVNLGLPVLECAETTSAKDGSAATMDAVSGKLELDDGVVLNCEPFPDFLMQIVNDGGLVPHLEKRFSGGASR
ncbi:MAG: 3-isopropylmalate dehydratase [Rhizobiaceae bacterium]